VCVLIAVQSLATSEVRRLRNGAPLLVVPEHAADQKERLSDENELLARLLDETMSMSM